MLKSLLTGLFFIYFLAGNAYAEDYNDILWGMLKKENQEIVFVRCDSPSLKMKIVRTADANQENIEKAYQTFNQSKGQSMYFAFIGNVKDTGNGNYVFNMYDVMETKTGRCNLTDALNNWNVSQ